MTVLYRLELNISGIDPGHAQAVREAAEAAWTFEEEDMTQNIETGELGATGEDTLTVWNPEAREKSCHDDICKEIWQANGGYCHVFTRFINLEEGPEFNSSPEDYERLMEAPPEGQ